MLKAQKNGRCKFALRLHLSLIFSLLLLCFPAQVLASDPDVWELNNKFRLDSYIFLQDRDEEGKERRPTAAHDIDARIEAKYLLDNGARLGFTAGLGAALPPLGSSHKARTELESFFISFENAYGEVRLGRQEGIAQELWVRAPSFLSSDGVSQSDVDRSGAALFFRHKLHSDFDHRISYLSPRFGLATMGSLSIAVSYAPLEKEVDIAFVPLPRRLPGYDEIKGEKDLVLHYQYRGEQLRLMASFGLSHARWRNEPSDGDDLWVVSTGFKAKWQAITFGASHYRSNGGRSSRAEYRLTDGSILFEKGQWG